ncbi:MAG: von Willebrand factor type A domain-containing protein [Kofleriaceae bacterium]|nr:von Willebrand factor type A domain-containing protein [Kofleriaceae bacterium]
MRKFRQHRFVAAAATLTLHATVFTIPLSQRAAYAQTATTGMVRGIIKDSKTGEPLIGVTIIATSPALKGTQSAVSDENGLYVITSLPPGVYTISFYYADAQVNSTGVRVNANGTTTNNAAINPDAGKSEVITIKAKAPQIDVSTTQQGLRIQKEILAKLPVAGRSFEGAALQAAGTRPDGVGVSMAGSSSLENNYVVDGINSNFPPAPSATPGPPPLDSWALPKRNTSAESYDPRRDNPFIRVADAPMSTFSTDVDTASYANFRGMVRDGVAIPADAVRVEEWLNYFRYDDRDQAQPAPGEPLAIRTEVSTSPWNPGLQLLRVALRTPELAPAKTRPRNLVFLIDVSGSMQAADKLPLLQRALPLLVEQLRPDDRVAVVVYAGSEGLALPSTPGNQRSKIGHAIATLAPGGSTNGAAGIELAYAQAEQHLIKGGINRVILCSDGDFNVGITSRADLTELIERKREAGVFLTVLGFGTGNLKDDTMEMLADKGNGNYAYIDSLTEARKVLVKEAGATLVTVAKDVKLQLEFNPATVAGYRLIGYENRLLADEDFNNDKKDAGDMGAGHTVTALYEIVPAGVAVPKQRIDPRRYGSAPTPPPAAPATHLDELLTVKVRYKEPSKASSQLLARTVAVGAVPLAQASESMRWATAVATAAALIRQSAGVGDMTLADAVKLGQSALGTDRDGYRKEFLTLLDGKGPTLQAMEAPRDDLINRYRRNVETTAQPYIVDPFRTALVHNATGGLSFAAMCFQGLGQCER